MIREFLEKKKAKRIFKKVVGAKTAAALVEGNFDSIPFHHGRIAFLLVFVRGETPDEVSTRIAQVARHAAAQGATFRDMMGALVMLAFDTHQNISAQSGVRLALVQVLRAQLGQDIKIVHGVAAGYHGLLGEAEYVSFGVLLPHFDNTLGMLSRLEFGEAAEIS